MSKIEQGYNDYTAEDVRLVCVHFGIEDMPLSEIDCKAFRQRLYMWRDLMRDRRLVEAKERMGKMSAVIGLDPFDDDLPVLYRLFEAMLYYYDRSCDGNLAIFYQKIDALKDYESKMNIEHTYYYEYCLGLVHSPSRFDIALIHYERAFDVMKKNRDVLPEYDGKLLHNIAMCYTGLELPHHAIFASKMISQSYIDKREQSFGLSVNIRLALNLAKICRFDFALDLLEKCLVPAKSVDDKVYLASTLYNIGYTHMLMKSWEEAFKYFNEALQVFGKDSAYYYWGLYHQIYIKIRHEKHSDARKLLAHAKATNPSDKIPFISLEHYLSVSKRMKSHYDYNKEALEYIENVTIPYFMSIHGNMEATNYCNLLEEYYENKTHRKFLTMAKIKSEIYNKMLFHNQGGDPL